MADYYTPTVVDPMIPLAAMLPIERLFLSQVFDEELTSEAAYYCSEDGARDLISLSSAEVRAALDAATPASCPPTAGSRSCSRPTRCSS